MFELIVSEPVHMRVISQLRQNIFWGVYPPGHRLSLDQLAEEFECSRTPIREVFQILDSEGLVDYVPRKGAFVKDGADEFIKDYYETRKWMEAAALEWALAAGMDTAPLERYMEEETQAYEDHDIERLLHWGKCWRMYLYHACNNSMLETYLINLWKAAPRSLCRDETIRWNLIQRVFERHKKITAALCDGDCALAQRYNEEDFDEVRQFKLSYLRSEEGKSSSAY